VSRLASQLARQEAEEIALAIRALLVAPLLTAERDMVALDLVRRHGEALTSWFDENCGWQLQVEPRRGYARLHKTTPPLTPPARPGASGPPALPSTGVATRCSA